MARKNPRTKDRYGRPLDNCPALKHDQISPINLFLTKLAEAQDEYEQNLSGLLRSHSREISRLTSRVVDLENIILSQRLREERRRAEAGDGGRRDRDPVEWGRG